MAIDLVQIRTNAKAKEDENLRFRQFLKSRCKLDPALAVYRKSGLRSRAELSAFFLEDLLLPQSMENPPFRSETGRPKPA